MEKHTAALNPPSRLITQFVAYSFFARNKAASAISSTVPKRFRGIFSRALLRAVASMALGLERCKLASLLFPPFESKFTFWDGLGVGG